MADTIRWTIRRIEIARSNLELNEVSLEILEFANSPGDRGQVLIKEIRCGAAWR
jgi:hypothetical protein